MAVHESKVPSCQGLILDLLTGIRIASAFAGIDNFIAIVHVVFVALVEHDRLCAVGRRTGNTSLIHPMHARLKELMTVLEEGTDANTCHLSECHIDSIYRNGAARLEHLSSRTALRPRRFPGPVAEVRFSIMRPCHRHTNGWLSSSRRKCRCRTSTSR
jgi:hypothetical protein